VCGATENLWLCLVCGTVGCGRYAGAHAVRHFEETAHSFALDVATRRVWDYIEDDYVHRVVQNKTGRRVSQL
jgi:BRCA1-associated protein